VTAGLNPISQARFPTALFDYRGWLKRVGGAVERNFSEWERPFCHYDDLVEFLKDLRSFFMPLDVWLLMLKCSTKNRFRLRLRRPRWELTEFPQTLNVDYRGLLLRERQGIGKSGRKGNREGRGAAKGEGEIRGKGLGEWHRRLRAETPEKNRFKVKCQTLRYILRSGHNKRATS